jgi:hypothetical protein
LNLINHYNSIIISRSKSYIRHWCQTDVIILIFNIKIGIRACLLHFLWYTKSKLSFIGMWKHKLFNNSLDDRLWEQKVTIFQFGWSFYPIISLNKLITVLWRIDDIILILFMKFKHRWWCSMNRWILIITMFNQW